MTESFLLYKFNRSFTNNQLGHLEGVSDYKHIEGHLSQFVDDSISYDVAYFNWDLLNNTIYSNNIFVNINRSDYPLFINNSFYYRQGYILWFQCEDINGNWEESEHFLIYFTDLNDSSFSGELINPDAPDGGVDVDWINNMEYLFKNDEITQENTQYILNNLFSGDLFSGDSLFSWGYNPDFGNFQPHLFINNFFRQLIALLTESGNETINFNIHNNNFTFNSSDFIIPENPLKVFIRIFLIAGSIFLVYQQFHKLTIKILTADFFGIVNDIDVDESIYM